MQIKVCYGRCALANEYILREVQLLENMLIEDIKLWGVEENLLTTGGEKPTLSTTDAQIRASTKKHVSSSLVKCQFQALFFH